MQKIEPFKNSTDASLALDNGGRFFNIFTKPNDGEIELSELSKVAGAFGEKQKMVLFLDLAISKLRANDKILVISSLSNGLRKTYDKYKSQFLTASQAAEKGKIATNIIVTGIPKLIDSKTDFSGFIMVPIMVDKVMIFTMIPIFDSYDVYEIRDHLSSDTFLIAHAKGELKLPEKPMVVAGILKELKANKEEKTGSKKYLESYYYMDAS